MNGPLKMSGLQIFASLPSATSLLESAFGRTRSDSQSGRTTVKCGPEVVRANLSARQAKAAGLLTSGTFGRVGSISSTSADLTRSLVNRLKLRLKEAGSTLFRMTWKELDTDSGRVRFRLAASGHRISDKESTLSAWRTPDTNQSGGCPSKLSHVFQRMAAGHALHLSDQAILTNWPTPQNHDDRKRGNTMADHYHFPHDLPNAAELASWPTPVANDDNKSVEAHLAMKTRMGGNRTAITSLQVMAQTAGWVSPTAQDHSRGTKPPRSTDTGIPLSQQVSGLPATGSPASTESRGQLNPAHSRWLMGLPPEWDDCGVTGTHSSRRKQRSS